MSTRAALGLVGLLMFGAPLMAHKYHVSLTEMNLNRHTGMVEVVVRVFAEDLEKALAKTAGKSVRLDQTEAAEKGTFAYLTKHLRLFDKDGKLLEARWIGMEFDVHNVWAYFEIPLATGLQGLQIQNRLFFDFQTDQVNTVNIKQDGRKRTFVFKLGESAKRIDLN